MMFCLLVAREQLPTTAALIPRCAMFLLPYYRHNWRVQITYISLTDNIVGEICIYLFLVVMTKCVYVTRRVCAQINRKHSTWLADQLGYDKRLHRRIYVDSICLLHYIKLYGRLWNYTLNCWIKIFRFCFFCNCLFFPIFLNSVLNCGVFLEPIKLRALRICSIS